MEDEIQIEKLLEIVQEEKENAEREDALNKKHSQMINVSLPDPAIANYWRDRADRIVWIEDEITDDITGVARNIIRWNREDEGIPVEERTPITIYFNSPGGQLLPTFAVCDVIRMSKTPIHGINMHEAASAAAMIFSCCHRRAACPNAFFLLHLGSGGCVGTYQQTRAQQEDYNHKIEQMTRLYKEALSLTDCDEFDKLIDSEWYLYADVDDGSHSDARRYNLITDDISTLLR